MENGNFVYKGWKCNGFLALVLIFGGLALGVYAIVAGAQRIDAGLALGGGLVAAGVVWSLCMLICMAGFMLLEPNEARVMVFSVNTKVPSTKRVTGGSTPSCRPSRSRSAPAT